jgi:hypothetical protein
VDDLAKLADWGFRAVLSGGIALAVSHLKNISGTMSEVKVQLASLFEKLHWHKERLDNHESRITNLETSESAKATKFEGHEFRITKLEETKNARR